MATEGNIRLSADKDSEEYFELLCHPCSADDKSVEAVKFCEECGENFCSKCIKDHNKFSAMKTHTVRDIGHTSRQGQVVLTEKCLLHNGNIIDSYCRVHDVVCCQTCVSLNHRGCKGVTDVTKAAIGVINTKAYKDVNVTTARVRSELQLLKESKENDKTKLERERDKYLTEIQILREEINNHLDELERIAVNKIDAKFTEINYSVNADIKALEQMLTMLDTSVKQLNKANVDNEPQVFVRFKIGKLNQNEGSKLLQEIQTSSQNEEMDFKVNTTIAEYIKSERSLGEMIDERIYSASLIGRYSVNISGDKSCNIFGSCQLQDNTLLITDWNNKSLKRLDESYNFIDQIKLPGSPYAVCVVNSGEVAVTLTYDKKIQFVSLANKMALSKEFKIKECCRGIAYANGVFVVTCGGGVGSGREGPAEMRTYDKDGLLLSIVKTDLSGTTPFSLPWHIAVSADATLFYVADSDKGVITLDRHGKRSSRFSSENLNFSCGVCRDVTGQLFVCGRLSNQILQISRESERTLLDSSDNVKLPRSVLFDQSRQRLVVTSEDSDEIAVYSMSWK